MLTELMSMHVTEVQIGQLFTVLHSKDMVKLL